MKTLFQLKEQAVRATFQDILSEDQLVQAINMINTDYRSEDTSSLIDYVIRVGNKFGIDKSLRKSLYPKFFSYLNNPVTDSTTPSVEIDVESQQNPPPVSQQLPSSSPVNKEVETTNSTLDNLDATKQIITEDVNPKMSVFLYFIERLIFHFPSESKELFEEVSVNVKKEKSFTEREEKEIILWLNKHKPYQFNVGISEKAMSLLIHLFYISLCEFLGPIDADELFHLILDDCKQLSAAKKFDPKRFL